MDRPLQRLCCLLIPRVAAFCLLATVSVSLLPAQEPNRVVDLFSWPGAPGEVGHPHDLLGSQAAAVGDVDGDGHLDVYFAARAFVEYHLPEARLVLGDGEGGFTDVTATHVPADRNLIGVDVELGDVDGDGDLDALVFGGFTRADADLQKMSLLQGFFQYLFVERLYLNDGAGRFQLAPADRLPAVDDNTQFGALFDADGDGDLDVYLANKTGAHRTGWSSDGQNRLWINDGSGTFTDETATRLPDDASGSAVASGEWGLAIADLDGDGDLDVVTASDGLGGGGPERLVVDRNDGTGVFTRETSLPAPFGNAAIRSVTALDVDGDGREEVLVTVQGSRSAPPALELHVLDHDPVRGFVAASAVLSRTSLALQPGAGGDRQDPTGIGVLDLDGDGDSDALVQAGDFVYALRADGATGTTVLGPLPGGERRENRQPARATFAPGDFDSDGRDESFLVGLDDLKLYDAAVGAGGSIRLRDRLGGLLPAGLGIDSGLGLGDVDGDGDVDIVARRDLQQVAPGDEQRRTQVFLNDGNGSFEGLPASSNPTVATTERTGRSGFVVADVDGDGAADVLAHLTDSFGVDGVRLWRGDGSGDFGSVPAEIVAPHPAGVRQLEAVDLDRDGAVDLVLVDGRQTDVVAPRILRGLGDGRFVDWPGSLPAPTATVAHVEVGDVDGDGDLDLVLAGRPTDLGTSLGGSSQTMLWLGDGAGNFADATAALPTDSDPTASTTLVDVDHDGDLDLLLANQGVRASVQARQGWSGLPAPRNALWRNDGAGGFVDVTATSLPAIEHHSWRILPSDFDGDGAVDLYVVGESELSFGQSSDWTLPYLTRDSFGRRPFFEPLPDLLWLGDGAGRFTVAPAGTVPGRGVYKRDARSVDLDGDGDEDLLFVARAPANRVLAIWNRQVHLDLDQPPILGHPLRLTPWHVGANLAGGAAVTLFGPTRQDLPVPGLGTLRIAPLGLVTGPALAFVPGAGQPKLAFPVPNDVRLIDLPVVVQVLVIDGSGPRLGNAHAVSLGR